MIVAVNCVIGHHVVRTVTFNDARDANLYASGWTAAMGAVGCEGGCHLRFGPPDRVGAQTVDYDDLLRQWGD